MEKLLVALLVIFVGGFVDRSKASSAMLRVNAENRVAMSRDTFALVDLTFPITQKSNKALGSISVDLRPYFGALEESEEAYTSAETNDLVVRFDRLPIAPFFKTFRGDRIRFYVNNRELAKYMSTMPGAYEILHRRLSLKQRRAMQAVYRQVDVTDLIKRMGLDVDISLSKYVSIAGHPTVDFSIKVTDPSVFYPFKVVLQDERVVEFVANSDDLVEYFEHGGRERESIAEKFDTEDAAMQDDLQDRIVTAMAKNDEMRQLILDSLVHQLSMQTISPDKIPEEDLRKGVSTAEDVMRLYRTLMGRALMTPTTMSSHVNEEEEGAVAVTKA